VEPECLVARSKISPEGEHVGGTQSKVQAKRVSCLEKMSLERQLIAVLGKAGVAIKAVSLCVSETDREGENKEKRPYLGN